MTTKILVLIFSIAFTSSVFAKKKNLDVRAELYYSNGNYSSNITTNGFYGFANFIVNDFDLIRIGYNKIYFGNVLDADDIDWKYQETNYSIGGMKNLYPFYIKTSFIYMSGEYYYQDFVSNYLNNLYTLAFEIDYNVNLFYVGLNFAYTSSSSDSLASLNSKQFGLPFTYSPSNDFNITITPTYTSISDREDLFSAEILLKYSPTEKLTTYLGGFIGKRAYFYNHDLYTIFNQNATQTGILRFAVEYMMLEKLTLIGGYTYTEFEDYLINFYTVGLRFVL